MEKQKLNISCRTVTLSVFMACLFRGDYRQLDANASDEELHEAWQNLYEEYSTLSGNAGYRNLLSTTRRLEVLRCKLPAAGIAVLSGTDSVLSGLEALGYSRGDAKRIKAEIKRDTLEYEVLLAEMNSKNTGKGSKEDDFIDWITVVSKHVGYRIDPNAATVAEFLSANRLMERESKARERHPS